VVRDGLGLKLKRFIVVWTPPRLFLFFRGHIRNYLGWKRLSPVVKNWAFCWLANALKGFAHLSARTRGLSFQHQREKLVMVRYRSGLRLLSFPSSVGVVSHAQDCLVRPFLGAKFQSGDVAIDIGAHVGAVSLPLAFSGVTVYAYEPHPDNFQVLALNKKLNHLDNLHVFPCAVSNSSGTARFEFGATSTLGSLSAAGFSLRKNKAKGIETIATTLSEIFADHSLGQVKLLKIDCEGSEYAILFEEGAQEALRKCRFLIMEVHPVKTDGWDKYRVHSYLTNLGFQIQVVENSGNGCADFYCKRGSG